MNHLALLQKHQFTVNHRSIQYAAWGSDHYQFPQLLCAQQYQGSTYCQLELCVPIDLPKFAQSYFFLFLLKTNPKS